MSSNNGSQSPFPGLSSANAFVRVYFDAWQNYVDTLNGVWGDVTAPDAKPAAWTSGWSRLLQAWTDGATNVFAAYGRPPSRASEEPVVTFVIDARAEAHDPRPVSIPAGVNGADVDRTCLRAVGAQRSDIDKDFLRVDATSGGRAIEIRMVNLGSLQTEQKTGTYLAVVYETAGSRPLAVVVVTFV
jgi:hypothetical protein